MIHSFCPLERGNASYGFLCEIALSILQRGTETRDRAPKRCMATERVKMVSDKKTNETRGKYVCEGGEERALRGKGRGERVAGTGSGRKVLSKTIA